MKTLSAPASAVAARHRGVEDCCRDYRRQQSTPSLNKQVVVMVMVSMTTMMVIMVVHDGDGDDIDDNGDGASDGEK